MTFKKLNIACIAHDNCKHDMLNWVKKHQDKLKKHQLICTGTTGKILKENTKALTISSVKSGRLGGDQEIAVKVANNEIDFIIFLVDGLSVQPHDSDVKALQRVAAIYNTPIAVNLATAELCIHSSLFANTDFKPKTNDFSNYINRKL